MIHPVSVSGNPGHTPVYIPLPVQHIENSAKERKRRRKCVIGLLLSYKVIKFFYLHIVFEIYNSLGTYKYVKHILNFKIYYMLRKINVILHNIVQYDTCLTLE